MDCNTKEKISRIGNLLRQVDDKKSRLRIEIKDLERMLADQGVNIDFFQNVDLDERFTRLGFDPYFSEGGSSPNCPCLFVADSNFKRFSLESVSVEVQEKVLKRMPEFLDLFLEHAERRHGTVFPAEKAD